MKPLFLLLIFFTTSLHASSPITANNYATFLNKVAASDPCGIYEEKMEHQATDYRLQATGPETAVACSLIIRSGEPGQYRYAVAEGKKNCVIAYVSPFAMNCYRCWKENDFNDDVRSSISHLLSSSCEAACDEQLRSNRITFFLPECSSSSLSHATMKEGATSWKCALGLFTGIASLFAMPERAKEELPLLHSDVESYGSTANTREDHTRQDSRLPDIRRIPDIENQAQVKNVEEEMSCTKKLCYLCAPGCMNGFFLCNSILASQWMPAAYAGPYTIACYCCCVATSLGGVATFLLKEVDSLPRNRERHQMTGAVPPCKINHRIYSPEVLDAYRPLLREKTSTQQLACLNPTAPVKGLENSGMNCFIHAPLQLCRALNIDINRNLVAMPYLRNFFADKPRTVADCQALRHEIATHLLKHSGNRDLQAVVINGESRSQQDATAFLRLLLQKTGVPPVLFADTLHDQTTGEERTSSQEASPILSLALPRPKTTGCLTMQEIIDHSLTTKTNLRWRENDVAGRTVATITKTLADPAPESLIVSLGRFGFNQEYGTIKRHDTIEGCFAPITLSQAHGNNINYEPIAIICHDGKTPNQGHYLCYCKENNRWLVFDDDKEVGIPESSKNTLFIKKNATIIAYRKISERA